MSPRNWKYRLEDILEAIANAQAYIQDIRFDQFTGDKKTIRAVAYEISIIGEAVRHIPAEVCERHPNLPWKKMQAMRNIVIHEYFRVDTGILWQTVKQDFPILASQLREMLVEEQDSNAFDM